MVSYSQGRWRSEQIKELRQIAPIGEVGQRLKGSFGKLDGWQIAGAIGWNVWQRRQVLNMLLSLGRQLGEHKGF